VEDVCRDRFAMIYLSDHDRIIWPEEIGNHRMDRKDHNDKTYEDLAGCLESSLPELIQGKQASGDTQYISKDINRAGPEK
jgi:hypothetical protein